ncbi:hypothetical protein NLI96_g7058 [Meripilus lineatus]|uniref:laccase n=1 Tax=Meripilus lineatus TaxID=2056292 RepID=A0AAD5YFD3_9APHY|nr:hypothetical protein NLI96_g7058 [Physisporinus lineatus]
MLGFVTLPLTLFFLFPSSGAWVPVGPKALLHISNANISPDGIDRPAIVVNGQHPGPLIRATKGDTLKIDVFDGLSNEVFFKSTSVPEQHWHGLFQRGQNWADGTAFITQCPIARNHSFPYKFVVPHQAGTFWYHSHLSTQYCDGLRGPLVIYDPEDPHRHLYDVDDENTVISLTDWYHTPAIQLPLPPARFPNSTLINGLGRYSGGPESDLAVITVQQGKRYRFRLISMSCDANFRFSIDDHKMTVIEVDGVNSQLVEVDLIPIYAAQRYSFVLHANQPVGNYWIRAQPSSGNSTFLGGLNSAILRYTGAPSVVPTTSPNSAPEQLNEFDLHPWESMPVPGKPYIGGADVNILLNFTFSRTDNRFLVNNSSFVPPTVPVLLQILSGVRNAHEILPPGSIFSLPRNVTVEVQMPGGVIGGAHPIHLHGHNFWVVRSAGSNLTNFHDPIVRDTVSMGDMNDNIAIRFQTNNPGPWFLHCHIDFHLNLGFATVFAEDIDGTAAANPVPLAWDELCPIYYSLPAGDL